MKNVGRIVFAGLAGTSLMTVFSYRASVKKGENFREPELLADFLNDFIPETERKLSLTGGWLTHYSMGLVWAGVEMMLLDIAKPKSAIKAAVALGTFSGLTGILIWDLCFKYHPNSPQNNRKKFYGNLFLAHMVYSLVVVPLLQNRKH
jgi:hypothetical protein